MKVEFKKPETERQQMIFDSAAESLGHQNFGIDTDIFEALDSFVVEFLQPVWVPAKLTKME